MKDPVRDAIVKELRAIRKMPGLPSIERLTGQNELIDALGYGDVERAWARLERLREEHGSDPQTDIGAYFYLSGWGIGRDTLTQRKQLYANEFGYDERTAVRRGDRGADQLGAIIRDQSESKRPWGLITLFQSGNKVDFIVRLMMAYESWRPAEIRLNGEDISDPVFTLHKNHDVAGGYYHQLIAEAVPVVRSAGERGAMATLLVHWPMPVWPTWQTVVHTPRQDVTVRTRTFRDRGIEVRLEVRSPHAKTTD